MSYNAIISIEQEEHDRLLLSLSLTRLSAWLTNTANLTKGDNIEFGDLGINFEVISILHKCYPGSGTRAPNSFVVLKPHRPLYDDEIQRMFNMGFEGK